MVLNSFQKKRIGLKAVVRLAAERCLLLLFLAAITRKPHDVSPCTMNYVELKFGESWAPTCEFFSTVSHYKDPTERLVICFYCREGSL